MTKKVRGFLAAAAAALSLAAHAAGGVVGTTLPADFPLIIDTSLGKPVIGFGALTLLRLRPAVAPGMALIVLAGIGFFWLLTFWLAQAPAAQVMRWLSLLFALVVLGQSTVGVVQFVRQDSAHLTFLGEPALDPRVEATSVVGPEGQHRLRAYGLTSHPNVLGGLLSIGLLWIMAGWLAGVPWPRVSPAISTVLWPLS